MNNENTDKLVDLLDAYRAADTMTEKVNATNAVREFFTPAAASAGAAGMIDTPEWRGLFAEYLNATGLVAKVAARVEIGRYADAAISAAYAKGRRDAVRDYISTGQAQATEGCCGHDSDCAVHNAPALPVGPCDCTIAERAATAPVSAAPTAQDIEYLRMHTRLAGDYLMRAQQLLGDQWNGALDDALASVDSAAAKLAKLPQSAGAPVSAAESRVTPEMTHALADAEAQLAASKERREERRARLGLPADGQELPAPTDKEIDDACFGIYAADFQDDPTGYDRAIARAALAMHQPDPAGEWVKRADLAMGQQGELYAGDALVIARYVRDEIYLTGNPCATDEDLQVAIKKSGIAAKQAGK